jgi:hypothetical protein
MSETDLSSLPSSPPIVFANGNFELSAYTFKPTEWLGEFVRDAGFDGVEVHPIFHRPKEIANAALKGQIDINSVHQSFRATGPERNTNMFAEESETSIIDAALRSPIGRLMLPNMRGSAKYMQTLQSIIGYSLPGIFYPQEDAQRDIQILESSDTEYKLFQPTDHVAKLLGVTSLESLHAETTARGYDGYCLDTFHSQRFYGRDRAGLVSNLDKSLNDLVQNTKALHVSLNRADFTDAEPHIPTREDLITVLNGNFSGRLNEMLTAVREAGKAKFIVVELGMSGLKDLTHHTHLKDLQKDYKEIGNSLRTFFGSK